MTVVQALRRPQDEAASPVSSPVPSSLKRGVAGGEAESDLPSPVTRSGTRHKSGARRRDRLVQHQSPENRGFAHESNSNLITMAGQGSQPAWNELLHRHGRYVWQIAKRNGL